MLAALIYGCLPASADAADLEPTPIQAEIMLLQDTAETQKAESLKQLEELLEHLPAGAREDDRREALSAVIDLYIQTGQQAKAAKLNTELEALAKREHDDHASALALDYHAVILQDQGKNEEAAGAIDQALTIAARVKSKKLMSRVNGTASIVYGAMGKFQKALEFQLAAMNSLEEGNRHAELRRISAMNNIGTLYESLKNPKAALDYYIKAGKLAKSLDAEDTLATLAINRGIAYSDLGNQEEAAKAYTEALELSRKISDPRTEATALNNLADYNLSKGRYAECVRYAQDTIPQAQMVGDGELTATAYVNLGLCRINSGALQQGAADVKRGMDFFRESKELPQVELTLGQLTDAYEHAGQYQEALKALREQRELSDQLFRADRDRSLAELQAKFDAVQREKQIDALQQKNELQGVELSNKNLQRVIFFLAALAALATAGFVALLYRKVRRSNRELYETNLKLEQQSTRDPLTGLLNRRAFQDMMRSRAQVPDRRAIDGGLPPHALVLLDIDHFKLINDTYGHACGDLVLIELGRRLSQIMREDDMLMRWGGEEFLIYLNHIPAEHLAPIVERVLSAVGTEPIATAENSIIATTSAGYISLPLGRSERGVEMNWERALHLADTALYLAKTRGRNQAIGVKLSDIGPEDFSRLMLGDLEDAVRSGLVELEALAGPAQERRLAEQ
ncbi:MAG: diguanylate cyclase [Burkholderiaceae bacterium]|nr:diguanylate cyclase [Burkholderiaceae bacterium]